MIVIKGRELLIPVGEEQIGVLNDINSEVRVFFMDRLARNGIDLVALNYSLDIKYPDGTTDTDTLEKVVGAESFTLVWNIKNRQLTQVGTMFVSIRGYDQNLTVRWSSNKAAIYNGEAVNFPGSVGAITAFEEIESSVRKLYNQTKAAKDSAVTAKESAETADENASIYATNAETAKAYAQRYANLAVTSADLAESSAESAASSEANAKKYAEEAKNASSGGTSSDIGNVTIGNTTKKMEAGATFSLHEIGAVAFEEGKGLSTNDYDNPSKQKVDAIPENPKYTDTTYDNASTSSDGLMSKEDKNKLNAIDEKLTASDNLVFQFSTDGEGNYGYLKADGSFVPFKTGEGGILSSDVTALLSQVLEGTTALTSDSNDIAGTGTMPNRGTVLASVNLNESYTIPSGYHNGSGKVSGPTATSKAATTYNTSTSDRTIEAGVYTTGVQTIKAVKTSGISAANIKKGVTVKVGDANSATRIANVAGTLENLSKITITDSSCANKAVTCISESESLSGTMDDNGSYTFYVTKQETYTISCDGNTATVDGSVSQTINGFETTITFTVYSAANDTVYYKENESNVTLCTTDSTGKAKNVQLTFASSRKSITLYSIIADNPDNTSEKYSKTITLTKSTTEVKVMPDGLIVYWYGYENEAYILSPFEILGKGWVSKNNTYFYWYGQSYHELYVSPKINTNYNSYNVLVKRLDSEINGFIFANDTKKQDYDKAFSLYVVRNVLTRTTIDITNYKNKYYGLFSNSNGSLSNKNISHNIYAIWFE